MGADFCGDVVEEAWKTNPINNQVHGESQATPLAYRRREKGATTNHACCLFGKK